MARPDRSHHRKARTYLQWIVAILLVPAPAAVAFLVLVFGWLGRYRRRDAGHLPTLLIWGPMAVAGILALVPRSGLADAGILASALLLAGLTMRSFRVNPGFFVPLFLAQLLVLSLVGIEQHESRSMWRSVGTQRVSTDLQARFGGVQTIEGSNGPSWDDSRRWWSVPEYPEVGTGETLGVLEFDARLVAGSVGWWWSPGGERVVVHEWRNDEASTVSGAWIDVAGTADRSTYVRRTYAISQTDFPPETIYFSFLARALATGREACAVLAIQTDQGALASSQAFCADNQGVTLAGTIPRARFADSEALEVVFTRIDADLILSEATVTAVGITCNASSCTSTEEALQANQTGVFVNTSDSAGAAQGSTLISPETSWAEHSVRLLRSATPTSPSELLTAHLKVEPGLLVEVRRVAFRPTGTTFPAHPLAGPAAARARLTSPHANILGHGVALVAIAFLLSTVPLPLRAAGFVVATSIIVASGSRAALVAVLGVVLWTWFQHMSTKRPSNSAHSTGERRLANLFVATLIIATAMALLTGLDSFARTTVGAPSRVDIWGAAISAIVAHPLIGLTGAGESFGAYWQTHHALEHAGISVSHAHSFVLDIGSRYGVISAVAAFLTLTGVVAWARSRAARAGTVLGAALVFLNVVDSTLLSSHVIVPFVVLVEALRQRVRA